ncbi:hypothetical protein ABTX80_31520 [Streptomyces erythrochromogenes]
MTERPAVKVGRVVVEACEASASCPAANTRGPLLPALGAVP